MFLAALLALAVFARLLQADAHQRALLAAIAGKRRAAGKDIGPFGALTGSPESATAPERPALITKGGIVVDEGFSR